MILVSHAYLGGTRQEWWEEYRKVLETDVVTWTGFDAWVGAQDRIVMPNADIPVNTEVKYVDPKPAKPMDEYEPVTQLSTNEIVTFHNGEGAMCLEALAYFKQHGIRYTEFLTTDNNFRQTLKEYQSQYPESIGESATYQYLPIIFYRGVAYSGFNDTVASEILQDWQAAL